MAHEFDVWDVEGYTSVDCIGLIIENKTVNKAIQELMSFFCIKKHLTPPMSFMHVI